MCAVMDMQTAVLLRTLLITKGVEYINSQHRSGSTKSYNHYRCAWIVTRIRFRSWSSHAQILTLCEPCANSAIICPFCSEVIEGTIRVYIGFNLRKKTM